MRKIPARGYFKTLTAASLIAGGFAVATGGLAQARTLTFGPLIIADGGVVTEATALLDNPGAYNGGTGQLKLSNLQGYLDAVNNMGGTFDIVINDQVIANDLQLERTNGGDQCANPGNYVPDEFIIPATTMANIFAAPQFVNNNQIEVKFTDLNGVTGCSPDNDDFRVIGFFKFDAGDGSADAGAMEVAKAVRVKDSGGPFVTSLVLDEPTDIANQDETDLVLEYLFTMTNIGGVNLTNVVVTDARLGGATCSPTGTITTNGTNSTRSCTIEYTVLDADVVSGIVNFALADSNQTDPVPSNEANVSFVDPGGPPVVSYEVEKSADKTTFTSEGETIAYTFEVRNTGTADIEDITIVDNLANPTQVCVIDLDAGQTDNTSCTFSYIATLADVTAEEIVNQGLYCDGPACNPGTPTNTVTIPLVRSELTVAKSVTTTPNSYSIVGDVIDYSILVTNSGNQTLSDLTITDPLIVDAGGVLSCLPNTTVLDPGNSVTCTGSYTVTQQDITNGSVANTAFAQALDPGGQTVSDDDTVSTNRDDGEIEERTKRIISNFMARRADLLLDEPDLVQRLRDRDGNLPTQTANCSDQDGANGVGCSNGVTAFNLAGVGNDRNHQMTFSTSLRQILASTRPTNLPLAKTGDDAGETQGQSPIAFDADGLSSKSNNWGAWVEGKWTHADYDTSESDFGVVYLAVDYRANPDLVVGLLGQVDWMEESDKNNSYEVNGLGWMIGPYMVAHLHENLYLDARAAWGQSTNDINPLGAYEDSFDTTRWLARAQLTGEFVDGALRFSPHVRVVYMEEQSDSYIDSLGNAIDGQTVSLGRLTFGPEVSYTYLGANGGQFTPHFGVAGVWDWDEAEIYDVNTGSKTSSNDLRGRIESGATYRFQTGVSARAEMFYDGLGTTDLDAYGFNARLSVPFD